MNTGQKKKNMVFLAMLALAFSAGSFRPTSIAIARPEAAAVRADGPEFRLFLPVVARQVYQIAFVSDLSGNSEIYRMGSDGSDLTRLTYMPAGGNFHPDWSPDGRKIAFVSYINDQGSDLSVMNSDGTGVVNLSKGPLNWLVDFDWSPDSSQLVFSSTFFSPELKTEVESIQVVNADGSGLRTLVADIKGDLDWSPDGEKIAFASGKFIYVIRPDGADPIPITPDLSCPHYDGSAGDPVWSPDGSQLAFTFYLTNWECHYPQVQSPAVPPPPISGLQVINPDGTGLKLLGLYDDPNWAPDGKSFVATVPYDSSYGPSTYEIWRVFLDGQPAIHLTDDEHLVDKAPDWSPDGRQVVYESVPGNQWMGGQSEIYRMNADGSGKVRLTVFPAQDVDPDWRPVFVSP